MPSRIIRIIPFALLFLCLALFCSPAIAQNGADKDPLDQYRGDIEQVELILQRDGLDSTALTALRRRLDPLVDGIRAASEEVQPKLKEVQGRLTQLGPKPDEKAAPEAPEVQQERANLLKSQADYDARIKKARLLETQIEQLNDRITDRRRQLFTAQLMERTATPFSMPFWSDVADGLPSYWRAVQLLASDWIGYIADTVSKRRLALALAASLLLAGLLYAAFQAFKKRRLHLDKALGQSTALRRLAFALRIFFERSVTTPVVIAATAAVLFGFELVLPRARPLILALFYATLAVALTRGVLDAVLAPGLRVRRLVKLNDDTADDFYRAGRNASLVYGFGIALTGLNTVLAAPVAIAVLTAGLHALLFVAVGILYLQRTDPADAEPDEDQATSVEGRGYGWTRPALWAMICAILGAVFSGYIALGDFLGTRLFILVLVWVATVLLLKLVDALTAMWFGAKSVRGRRIAAIIGVRPDRLELVGVILSGIANLIIIMAALTIVLGPWGLGGESVDAIDLSLFGLRFGDLRGLLASIAGALALLVIGLLLLKRLTSWVNTAILPRTSLEPGLSNSISTILGYAGIAAVVMMALRQLGIDFSNIGIVAGALSVGIGFGLQSIVSNFVSGLIVLAERPIRVDDTIIVKGEEGRVRRISVRSTELETFDRATVIVPNSDLITGVVKNLTHPDHRGRVLVPLQIGYQAGLERVIKLLITIGEANPLVKKEPPPSVFVRGFVADGIDLELRVTVSDLAQTLKVRSDLHIAIIECFAREGVELFPPAHTIQTVLTPPPPSMTKD